MNKLQLVSEACKTGHQANHIIFSRNCLQCRTQMQKTHACTRRMNAVQAINEQLKMSLNLHITQSHLSFTQAQLLSFNDCRIHQQASMIFLLFAEQHKQSYRQSLANRTRMLCQHSVTNTLQVCAMPRNIFNFYACHLFAVVVGWSYL